MSSRALLALAALVALATPALAEPQFPKLTGRVVDAANVIPDDVEARIDGKLAALETQSRRQLVVATIPDLQGYEISDYGYQLGRAWGIGSKEKNDGALLIVAPNQRKLRIEVGYGLEPVLTDGMSSLIINQTIVPRLREGDMAGGVDAIVTQLTLPEEEARKIAAAASRPARAPGIDPALIAFVVVFFFLFAVPMLRGGRRRGRRYGSGLGPIVVFDALSHMGGGRSSGWGGGGFGGGGGFSGGGGSFGGGGASGSW